MHTGCPMRRAAIGARRGGRRASGAAQAPAKAEGFLRLRRNPASMGLSLTEELLRPGGIARPPA